MTLPRLYDIKEAARYLGVASSTLRYWESEGLVQAGRGEANGRQYSLHDLIEASEIAFYRKLGVPVKELRGYRALSARSLDEALARTEDGVEQRIAELEATKARLARQRALNAKAEELRRAGMQPSTTMPRLPGSCSWRSPGATGWSSLRTSLTRFTSRPWTQARRTVPCFGADRALTTRRPAGSACSKCPPLPTPATPPRCSPKPPAKASSLRRWWETTF